MPEHENGGGHEPQQQDKWDKFKSDLSKAQKETARRVSGEAAQMASAITDKIGRGEIAAARSLTNEEINRISDLLEDIQYNKQRLEEVLKNLEGK